MPPKPGPARRSTRLTGKRQEHPTASPPKRKTKRRKPSKKAATPSEEEDYDGIEDPSRVTHPVAEHVHPSLADAWVIQPLNPMWFIFDGPTPARQFKRGVPLDETQDYPAYGKPPYADLTESEPEEGQLMPFAPAAYNPVFMLRCTLTLKGFLSWTHGELRDIEVGREPSKGKKGKQAARPQYTTQKIPAPYDHIVSQLLFEEAHGALDSGHEALRRQTYAQRVLDAFWKEIKDYEGEPAVFRSKVLTPLLQRQLWGVQENYSPVVRAAVRNGDGNPTINDATQFYLKDDPTDPRWIPSYRRNLLHVPEARWHLGILMGVFTLGCPIGYRTVRNNQDHIDSRVDMTKENTAKIPPLEVLDLQVIIREHLEPFFKPEMDRVPMLASAVMGLLEKRRADVQRPHATAEAGPSTSGHVDNAQQPVEPDPIPGPADATPSSSPKSPTSQSRHSPVPTLAPSQPGLVDVPGDGSPPPPTKTPPPPTQTPPPPTQTPPPPTQTPPPVPTPAQHLQVGPSTGQDDSGQDDSDQDDSGPPPPAQPRSPRPTASDHDTIAPDTSQPVPAASQSDHDTVVPATSQSVPAVSQNEQLTPPVSSQ